MRVLSLVDNRNEYSTVVAEILRQNRRRLREPLFARLRPLPFSMPPVMVQLFNRLSLTLCNRHSSHQTSL